MSIKFYPLDHQRSTTFKLAVYIEKYLIASCSKVTHHLPRVFQNLHLWRDDLIPSPL